MKPSPSNLHQAPAHPSHQRRRIEEFAQGSPEIAGWLAPPGTQDLLEAYDKLDQRAGRRRDRYTQAARMAVIFSTLATVIGAVSLLPYDPAWLGPLPTLAGAVQTVTVLLALLFVVRISRRELLNRWLQARVLTETARRQLFDTLMAAELPSSGTKPTLVGQLACFTHCHLDYQLEFYERRGEEHARAAHTVAPLKIVAYVIVGASVLVSIAVTWRVLRDLGLPLPPWLGWFDHILQLGDPVRLQLGLGALSSAVLSFVTAWALIS